MRFTVSAVLLLAFAVAVTPAAAPQTATPASASAQAEKLPPISYTCPMHPEILESKGGICPICKMDLVPIRLDSVWTCGTKPLAVVRDAPGRCPIDGTALVQVTAVVSWTCPGGTEESASPGNCPGGAPKTKTYALRAHGNHNPQHGGLFFMAADNTHHLEGTYLSNGTFRMHFYDEFTKPQKIAAVRAYKATLVVKDPKAGKETTYSLVRSGATMQAAIGKVPLPAEMYASVTFAPGGKPNRFDFTFPEYSKEPHAVGGPTLTKAAPMPATTAPVVETLPAPSDTSAGIDPALVPLPIPDRVPEILAQLKTRTDQIRSFIDKGTFAAIYVPAFQAKDLALALDEHKNELTPEHRKIAEPAIAKLVRCAYLLDAFGDIGNKQQIAEAYAKFVEAATDIHTAFPPSAGRNPQ
ncbi:MAG TPA: heavy metal-binding domain-containing protein [Vicinamibacterales bacterium]|nr:heavy metal-binding domain-containing protein [Vicinamibacterales bacterium]